MQILIELLIGLVVAIIIYNFLHHFLVVIPDRRYQKAVKKVVDKEVFHVIAELKQEQKQFYIKTFVNSQVLTNVWGRGVMVFEYKCYLNTEIDVEIVKTTLENKLTKRAKSDGIVNERGHSKLIVTDCWLTNDFLVFDVADQQNKATNEYISDIKKMDKK